MEFAKHSEQINAEASDWFTLIRSSSVTAAQQQQFDQWLSANDEHRDAYRQLEIIWDDLAELSTSPEGAALRKSGEAGPVGRFITAIKESASRLFYESTPSLRPQLAMALAGGVAVIVGAVYMSQPPAPSIELYATGVAEIKTVALSDGSQITLGANSTVETWSDSDERRVVLNRGQAFFVVTGDPERPFRVDAEDTRVEVVGTQFDVRSTQDRVRVAVLEGVVNVTSVEPVTEQADNAAVTLTAGQQVIKARAAEFQPVKNITELELGGWRQGRLVYRNASLVDVIGDANRYFDGTISMKAGDLSGMKVTLALRASQVEFLPELLAQTLPIEVHRRDDKRIVLSLREEK